MIAGGIAFLSVASPAPDAAADLFAEAVTALDGRANAARFRSAEWGSITSTNCKGAGGSPQRLELLSLPRDDIAALDAAIRAAHVVVVTGNSARQHLLLVRALAIGRPVLAIDTAFYRDIIDAGANGWLTSQSNSAALAGAMVAILKRPDLLPAMARSARLKAERRLDLVDARNLLFRVLGLPDLRSAAA